MLYCPRCRSLYNTKRARCGLDEQLLQESAQDPLVGLTLDDRYLIVHPISSGGMGVIYRAKHAVLEHEYAIKILWGELASAPQIVERFKREARAVSRLRHENIVSVTDFGRSRDGLVYLTMELVEGRTLEKAIAQEGPFPPRRAARIARQIAEALGEAHRIGFVHRDVKPANVMLTSDDDALKLLDFGLVAIIEPSDERLTKMGSVLGTPKYMSPEQCLDPKVNEAADLYSLGVILHEMLAGQPPFNGSTIVEVLAQHLESDPPPAPPSEGLETLVAWLLMKKPSQRPPNCAAVIREIDRLFSGANIRVPVSELHVDTDKEMNPVHIHFEEPVEASQEESWDPDGAITSAIREEPEPQRLKTDDLLPTPSGDPTANTILDEPEIPQEVITRRKKKKSDGEQGR